MLLPLITQRRQVDRTGKCNINLYCIFSQSTCEIEIEVLDRNDNIPQFEFTSYTGHVAELSPRGATVFVVSRANLFI